MSPKRKASKQLIHYVLAAIAFLFTLPLFWEKNILAGIGFLMAVIYALYTKALVRHPHIMGYIILGTLITYLATFKFIPLAWYNLRVRNFVGLAIVLVVFGLIYLAGYRLKNRKK